MSSTSRKLRVAVLMHEDFLPPETIEGLSDKDIMPWKTEYDVLSAVQDLGHDAAPLAVSDDFTVVRDALRTRKPHIVFNLLEEFGGSGEMAPHLLGYLELVGMPYTGCNTRALVINHSKTLVKKVLRFHRIRTPGFVVFPKNRVVKPRRKLPYPLFVKSSTEHGSVGISQASIVQNDAELIARVAFVHEQIGTDAIAEEYIDGRELYVGVIGNQRLQTFPVWELIFKNLPDGAPRIATQKAKWDLKYQERQGIKGKQAKGLSPKLAARFDTISKRVYRLLGLSGYARLDFRLTADEQIVLLEANPNPSLEFGDYFADSAAAAGIEYEALLQRILNLGLRFARHRT